MFSDASRCGASASSQYMRPASGGAPVTIIANFPFDDGFRIRRGIEPRFWRDRVQHVEPVSLKTFPPQNFRRGVFNNPCTLGEFWGEFFSSQRRFLTRILKDC